MTASVVELDHDTASPLTQRGLHFGALIGAAGLLGFGLILWIAANWDGLGRFGRFGLAGAAMLAGGLGAIVRPSLKAPSLLVGFAATGGMLALIGQTYQTGADAWQLFAVWAALTLPWAFAARSDAIWTPWAIVATTAVALFQQSSGVMDTPFRNAPNGAFELFVPGSPSFVIAATWILALGICAALSPNSIIGAWLGSRRWAFRVAAMLMLVNIATFSALAVFSWPNAKADIVLLGFAALAGTTQALAATKPRDMLLLACSVFAIDVVLITALARGVVQGHGGGEAMAFFVVGLGAAVVIAVSVIALQNVGPGTEQPATALQQRQPQTAAPRAWPVVILSGLGALLAAIPFIVALAIFFGNALHKGPMAYVIGIALGVAGLAFLRKAESLFVEQIATVAFAVGTLLLVYAMFRDLPPALASLLIGIAALAIAFGLGKPWAGGLLGAIAAAGFAACIALISPRRFHSIDPMTLSLAWYLLVAAWAAAALALNGNRQWLEPLRSPSNIDAIMVGWIAAALIGLSYGAGPTFLLDATIGSGRSFDGALTTSLAFLSVRRGLGLLLAFAGAGLLLRQQEMMRTSVGAAIIATLVLLSWLMPTLGAVVLVLAVALTTGRRVVALAAAVATLWIAGSFYYNLALPLTQKAAILGVAGALLGGVALISGARLRLDQLPLRAGTITMPLALARGLAATGLLAVTGVCAQAIHEKEMLIRDGRPVFIALAPVDPRSLMQGDYMALRFALPDGALRQRPLTGRRPKAIGTLGDNGVLDLKRIGEPDTNLAAGEIGINLSIKNGRWIVVTDAWFFAERTAQKWEAARFGEFRVLPDGRALLVGMADKDRAAIK